MNMTTYLKNTIYNEVLRSVDYTPPANVYLALFTTATTDAGGGTEVTGGSYVRSVVPFTAPAEGAGSNDAAATFANMPSVTVTHAALMDAAMGGNMLLHGPLVSPKSIGPGDSVTIAIGDVDVAFS